MGKTQRESIMKRRDGTARPWQDAGGGSEAAIAHGVVSQGRCNKTTRGRAVTSRHGISAMRLWRQAARADIYIGWSAQREP